MKPQFGGKLKMFEGKKHDGKSEFVVLLLAQIQT